MSFVKDLTGMQFGKWTVIERTRMPTGVAAWLCRCECGNENRIVSHALTHGGTKSCGCLRLAIHRGAGLAGKTFGRLTTVSHRVRSDGSSAWLCRCECGSEIVVRASSLKIGHTKSCGCYQREVCTARIAGTTLSHGLSNTKSYEVYTNMVRRTTDPNDISWKNYGGRGIKTCDRWLGHPEVFAADMGEPEPGMTLERVDTNGPYSPENCVWATIKEQVRNRRNTLKIPYNGELRPLASVCEELGLYYPTIHSRLWKGWPPEKAISTPIRKKRLTEQSPK